MTQIRFTRQEIDWMVLDLNSFFASCEQQAHKELRGKYVGVVPMMGVDTTCLLAASKEAKRDYGLKTGTPVGEARRRCPDLVLVKADHKKYGFYHHKVMDMIESCTPIHKIMSIDEVALEMTGTQRQPDVAMALARKVKATIRAEFDCLTSSIGIAPNILLAKVASDMMKPDGLVLIRPCDLPDIVLPLALRDFSGIGPGTEKRLNRGGIFTVADIYNCEAKRLRAIWGGVEGERFLAKLHGYNVNRETNNKTVIGHQHVLEPHLRNTVGAYDVLHHLLIKATGRLRDMGYYCKRLSVNVKFERGKSDISSLRPPLRRPESIAPTNNCHADEWTPASTRDTGKERERFYWERETDFAETQETQFLLHILQEFWKAYSGQRPLRVGIMLHGLVPTGAHQGDLFETRKPAQLYTAIDSVNKKFGRHTVSFGLNTYVQEKVGKDKIAFQRVPENVYL